MSFLSEVESFSKSRLKNVETLVTTVDGKKLVECQEDGQSLTVDTGLRTLGFCEDTNPDTKIYKVQENLFISSQDGASNYSELKNHQVTHILNVATGVPNVYPKEFIYKNIELLDLPETQIRKYLPEIFEFINSGHKQGSVLVHCNAGISRSTTVVIAYLMYKMHVPLSEALQIVTQARPATKPNKGFMQQLQEYEQELRLSSTK